MNIIHGFSTSFHGCDFMVYKPMKSHLFMGFPWVHYFAPAFHGYFITHEKTTFIGIIQRIIGISR